MDNIDSTEKLLAEIARLKNELKKNKKYGLVWENKTEDVVELCKEKMPVLKEVKDKEIKTDPNKPTNIIIEGDNYHALSVLNYTHKGKIDVIYIDPPYNTGNKDFKYNDKFIDKEDTYRHSKWLSFINKRLKLAKNLLKNDGTIFISIDDNEYSQLKIICDELFGEDNLDTIIWHKVADDSGKLKITYRIRREHEYILVCYKNKSKVFFKKYLSDRNYKNEYTNPDNDSRGPYKQGIISSTEAKSKTTGKNYYTIKTPSGKEISRQWRFAKEEFDRLNKDNRIYYGKDGSSIPSSKVFINEQKETTPTSILSELGTAKTAGFEIENIFGNKAFTYPKPVTLIQHLMKISSDKDDLILDFMAGSGTTGHAVLQMNKDDQGTRKFILCTNNENKICEEVTYPRINKVINGYVTPKNEKVEGLGGNLKYFKTEFVEYKEITDSNKLKLTQEALEMLCIKEETYDLVIDKKEYKIYKNNDHYTGIILDQLSISEFKKAISNFDSVVSVYIFSLGDDSFDEEFEDIKQKVKLSPIPEAILKVYKKIFK